MTTTSEWHTLVAGVKAGEIQPDPAARANTYAQGATDAQKDYSDGERDAARVMAGDEPLRDPQSAASKHYQAGWRAAVDAAREMGLLP